MTYSTVKKKIMKQLGKIPAHEQFHFELLMNSWELYLIAHKQTIESNGVQETSRGLRQHPAVLMRKDAWNQIVKLSAMFGIAPLNRDLSEGPDDGLSELMEE